MGGAPSRETLVRHIVRDPRVTSFGGATTMNDTSTTAGSSPQAEIVLIPLIPDYFPSSVSPLFQQLVHVRREPTVSYYYRDARSTVAEHTVVHDCVGTDKEIYNWYMSLSEQRLIETDNELIALSRAGRVVAPVPCAVAFVYNADATPAASAAAAASGANGDAAQQNASSPEGATNADGDNTKNKAGCKNKQRRGKVGAAGFNNGFMTIENTARVPHHNLRVRIFGFVGDTRFCPPSMLPNQAAKTPMCLTVFLSKSAGGNHRAQVTLLAAYTYVHQLQEIGILRHVDCCLGGAAASTGQSGADAAGFGFPNTSSSPISLALASTDEMDLLAGLRGAGVGSQPHLADADPYRDPYGDPYSTEAHPDLYEVEDYDEQAQRQHEQQLFANSLPRGSSNTPLDGLGGTSPPPTMEMAKEIILHRPVEIIIHRADIPALCYMRELRTRMGQEAATTLSIPRTTTTAAVDDLHDSEVQLYADGDQRARNSRNNGRYQRNAKQNSTSFLTTNDVSAPYVAAFNHVQSVEENGQHSLKFLIRTVVKEEELHGSIDARSMGCVLLWASRFYATHFEQLIGGEAAKLRQELAQRNLNENRLDGTLSLTEDEPSPPKAHPIPGDVWITPHDTYVKVLGRFQTGERCNSNNNENSDYHNNPNSSSNHFLQHEMENWSTVPAGTVLRYAEVDTRPQGVQSQEPHSEVEGAWHVSKNEFAEDILLSLCRNACQVSRRASPTDEHWLLNRETGLPEGLTAGILIWREVAAGQVVYYGTTPDFLKQWMQSGAELEAAYRQHANNTLDGNASIADAAQTRKEGREEAAAVSVQEDGAAAAAGEGTAVTTASPIRYSTSITMASTPSTTVASKGMYSSHVANSPANHSGVSGGSRGSSSKVCCKGSCSSSMALYSVHTGFVCTLDPAAGEPLGAQSETSSPTDEGLASNTAEHGSGGSTSLAEARKTKTCRVQTDNPTPATAALTSAVVTAQKRDASHASTPVARSHVSLSRSVGHYNEARLSHSLPTYQRSPFAILDASSRPLVHMPSSAVSSTSSRSHSYSNLGYVDQIGSLSYGSGPNGRAAHTSSPYAHVHHPQQHQQDYATIVNLANACWIGLPDHTSRDRTNTPTVNVVVKQRRSVRLTPGASLVENATAAGNPNLCHETTQCVTNGSHSHMLPRCDAADAKTMYANTTMQPIAVSSITSSSSLNAGGTAAPVQQGSLPIHIFSSRESSSEDASVRQGGHSPSSQEQSRSLLRGDDALISQSTATRTHSFIRPPPRQSAAVDVRLRHKSNPNSNNNACSPAASSLPLRWTASSTAQAASMRGASVTFASGAVRHSSLLCSSRYQEPCQPVLSRPSSLATSELLASSVSSSSGSFSRKRDAMRPPPLFMGAPVESKVAVMESKNTNTSAPPQSTVSNNSISRSDEASGVQANPHLISTAPVAVVKADTNSDDTGEAIRSRSNSAARTPRQGNLSDSAKSSVGSNKYRWDWRGVSWNL